MENVALKIFLRFIYELKGNIITALFLTDYKCINFKCYVLFRHFITFIILHIIIKFNSILLCFLFIYWYLKNVTFFFYEPNMTLQSCNPPRFPVARAFGRARARGCADPERRESAWRRGRQWWWWTGRARTERAEPGRNSTPSPSWRDHRPSYDSWPG